MHKIQKVIRVGDLIYPPRGEPKKITKIHATGFYCSKEHFFYDEHRQRFYLTETGLREARKEKSNAKT